jgi:hypothetical protein
MSVEQNADRFAVHPHFNDRPSIGANAGHSGSPLLVQLYALANRKRMFHSKHNPAHVFPQPCIGATFTPQNGISS